MESSAAEQPDRERPRSGADSDAVSTRRSPKSVDDPGARIDQIASSVERATEAIRREAEKEANRYLQERRREADRILDSHAETMAGLAAGLDQAAEALRADLNRCLTALEEAATRLRTIGEEGRTTAASGRSRQAARQQRAAPTGSQQARRGSKPDAEPGRSRKSRNSERRSKQDAVMLRATEMAIAGRRREEIAKALKSEFGVSDPNRVLDRILGLGY